MARKPKVGLNYFPHNCDYDDELKYIIALHKELGYYVYFELLRRIYSGFGYYMHSSEKVLTLFSNEINVDINDLNVIINTALSEHLFNKSLHSKYEILTSKGVQERYFEAIKRRNSIDIINEYILIDYVNILGDNVNINLLNVDKSTQSKVKKSRVNNNIVQNEFERFWNEYDKKVGKEKSIRLWKKLKVSEKEEIFKTLPEYIKSKPIKQYRKSPEVYLRNKVWQDEIIPYTDNNNNQSKPVPEVYKGY